MSLFSIGGGAGTGKTTVCDILKARGYDAYDIDSAGFARWKNTETGYIHPKSSVKAEDRTPDFLKLHDWHVAREVVEQLRDKAIGHTVFLCGDIGYKSDFSDLFDGVFALQVDDETLEHRLATRTENDWGKQPHELLLSINANRSSYNAYRDIGATIVDATQPAESVVDEILSLINTDIPA